MAEFILYKQGSRYPEIVDYSLNPLYTVANLKASAGMLVFPKNGGKGAVFVDGRYTLAAKESVNTDFFDIEKLSYNNVINWIKNNIPQNSVLLIDPQYFFYSDLLFFKRNLSNYSFDYIDLHNYFACSIQPRNLDLYKFHTNRVSSIIEWLKEQSLEAYLICNPCFMSWIFGIRDLKNEYSCAVLGNLLIHKNGEYTIYLDESYDASELLGIPTKSMPNLSVDLQKINGKIGTNFKELSTYIYTSNMIDISCPIDQTVRTFEELQEISLAARQDSVAFIKFLHWFHTTADKISELDAVKKLEEFRGESPEYICKSFETIAAADAHAAIVHYSPEKSSNAYIDNILLIDAGGQYKNGTTDITRTICRRQPTQHQREMFTQVLKSHIALANAVFPAGTTGTQLDAITRYPLWQISSDYEHGTGHGIGYLLNVHEGKQSISKNCNIPLVVNTVMSNEPGYYEENNFGVRLENMIQVAPIPNTNYLRMETLSLIPFDPKFICTQMLTEDEKYWLFEYYKKIIIQLGKDLGKEVLNWLENDYLK